MNRPDQCLYPPCLAPDVEITPRTDGGTTKFIIGSAEVGRYLMLGAVEHQLVRFLNGSRTLAAVLEEFTLRNGSAPELADLARFLGKLEDAGILAGERAGRPQQVLLSGNQVYLRWKIFDPEPLFARLLPALRWIWTPWFFVASALLIAFAALMALEDWPEVLRYGTQSLHQHYLTILLAAWLVTVCHEFAHGMTTKAFGGRATEVGGLLVYYCLPALYCNVSGLHMIPQRGRRLWVIAAGVYWQLMVGALAFFAWLVLNPDTAPARVAMAVVLGSLLEVFFNANPLIKLDGYYFLSQWLGISNLMDRSRACWRRVFRDQSSTEARPTPRDRRILLAFGFLSFFYNLALPVAIVWYASQYLMDWFGFAGLLLSCLLGIAYSWGPAKKMLERKEEDMATNDSKRRNWKRFVPAGIAACLAAGLCLPWTASVGSYGTLFAIPGREAIIRAGESASLIALNVQPGQQVARGAEIGRMSNLDLEEQIAQVLTEMARVNAEAGRLEGEMGVQREATAASEWQLAQRRFEFNEVDREDQQIRARQQSATNAAFVLVSNSGRSTPRLPAALAALEAEVGQLQARLGEADRHLERSGKLFAEGILARSELDGAEARASALASDLAGARERFNAALIEHRRRHASARTDVNVAGSALSAGRAQVSNLTLQRDAARHLRASLEQRLALLEEKRARFVLAAPVTGTLFGEDLTRTLGQYFVKGVEICRIADTHELLVRVQVAEQALGDVAVGDGARVKTRAFPDRIFQGAVSKIGGESELDPDGQRSYRVELTIRNEDGLLRPGMTVFARVDFGRHMVGWLLGHKLKQALRPEMWML